MFFAARVHHARFFFQHLLSSTRLKVAFRCPWFSMMMFSTLFFFVSPVFFFFKVWWCRSWGPLQCGWCLGDQPVLLLTDIQASSVDPENNLLYSYWLYFSNVNRGIKTVQSTPPQLAWLSVTRLNSAQTTQDDQVSNFCSLLTLNFPRWQFITCLNLTPAWQ